MKFWFELDGALVRTSATLADDIRQGLRESVNVADIVRDVQTAFPTNDDKKRWTGDELRDWTSRHVRTNDRSLNVALEKLYSTGWVLGRDAAGAAYSHAVLNKAAPSQDDINRFFNIDWSSWTPGNAPAAALVRPAGALSKLLDSRNATIAGLNKTTLNRVGTRLADALNTGATDTELRDSLLAVLDDPRRALTIATTEMARATSVASLDSYKEFGLEQVEWLALDPCEICAANADQGAVDVGTEFDSGDTEPPAHPNCRCSLIPVVAGGDGAAVDEAGLDVAPAGFADGLESAVVDASSSLMESGADALAVDVHPDLAVETTRVEPVAQTATKPAKPLDLNDTKAVLDQLNFQRNLGFVEEGNPPEWSKSLTNYTDGTGKFHDINGLLREGDVYAEDAGLSAADVAARETDIKNLDQLIDSAPTTPKEMITYRGISDEEVAYDLLNLEPGDSFTEAGFASTSWDKNVAQRFLRGQDGVLMKIINPAGTPGLAVHSYQREVLPTTNAVEKEWLLPRSTTFDVVEVKGSVITVRINNEVKRVR